MNLVTERAIDTATTQGAEYAEARHILIEEEIIESRNGQIIRVEHKQDEGCGIRAWKQGSWGFASSGDISPRTLDIIAHRAVSMAKATSLLSAPLPLLLPAPIIANWQSELIKDPFDVSIQHKADLLLNAEKELQRGPENTESRGMLRFRRERTHFSNSSGSSIVQEKTISGGGIMVRITKDDEHQTRSYPIGFPGHFQIGGYEVLEQMNLPSEATRIREEAQALLTAPNCPTGTYDIILDSSQMALQLHETCGHPTELDRALKGNSYLLPEQLGKFIFGSELITVVSDPTLAEGLGSYLYDDEGVAAQNCTLIKAGLHVGFLDNLTTAAQLGYKTSSGTARASSWNRPPLPRISNICLKPGQHSVEDLLSDSDSAIWMETHKDWKLDNKHLQFWFRPEIAWEIKGGKKHRIFKNPSYHGTSPDFWGACDVLGDQNSFKLWGISYCTRGFPTQTLGTGNGAPPARFKKIKTGYF